MSWLDHPRYRRVRDSLLTKLRDQVGLPVRTENVVFLCGGKDSKRRHAIRRYLNTRFPQLRVFYAERVWDQIAGQPTANALELEGELAQLSDMVLIVVESPGTFAELGAFALHEALCKKILPIVDISHKKDSSFIITGPIRQADRFSDFRPPIFVDQDRVLEAADQIEDRIGRMVGVRRPSMPLGKDLGLTLVFFLADLVAVTAPVTLAHIRYYMRHMLGISEGRVDRLVGLAVAMELVRKWSLKSGDDVVRDYFFTDDPNAVSRPFCQTKLKMPAERAIHLAASQRIPEVCTVMSAVYGDRHVA